MEMGETTELFIPGDPVPKGRPRVVYTRGRVRGYTPDKTRSWESGARLAIAAAYVRQPVLRGPISMEIDVLLERPASTPRRLHPAVRPDWDNYAKAVCDAMAGIVYEDDGQIISCTVRKIYATEAGVRVRVTPICSSVENEGRRRHMGVVCG